MAEARRNWRTWFAVGSLALGACGLVCAQNRPDDAASDPASRHRIEIQSPPSGSLAGRLTDLHSVPLVGVPIVLRNQASGAELRSVTGKNGTFLFTHLAAGEYTLEADSSRIGHGKLDGILVTGGAEAHVQAAMHFEPAAPALLQAASPNEIPASPPATESSSHPEASMPATASTPRPALPLSSASRATLSTLSTQAVAWIATEPLQILPLVSYAIEVVPPSGPPATMQPAPPRYAVAQAETQAAPGAPLSLPLRAAQETQSVSAASALAAASPHTPPVAPSAAQPPLRGPAVAAVAQTIDPAAAATTTTVTAAQLQSLPVTGRHWQEFLLDTPAASASKGSSQESYRGSQESAEVTIDGANKSLKFGVTAGSDTESTSQGRIGQGADRQESVSQSMSQSWNGGRGSGLSEAAIRQVTATAGNVEAAGVRTSGGRTTIETERGGNALHGQGFYFDRQNSWGAQNPFTQWLQNTGTAAAPNFASIPYTPPDHESVWGLGMGSRILRNKLFWFGSIESSHRNDPGMPMARIPIGWNDYNNPPTCTGFFCPPSYPQTLLLSAQLNESESQASNDYFGIPGSASTSAGLEQLAALLAPAPRTQAQWMGFARIDWQAAERHHIVMEATSDDWNAPGGGIGRVSETYGSHSFGSSEASQQWMLASWQAFLTPNLLAVTQGSVGRTILRARPDTPSTFEQAFLAGNIYGQLPEIIVDSRYGFTIGNPARFGNGSYPDEKLYDVQEKLEWVHNKMLMKTGIELDHNADTISMLRNQTGTYHYATVANFISDALAFLRFGYADALDPAHPHNCDAAGKPWYTSYGQLMGLGALPCYASYSQMMGPTNWHLSTNDWAGYVTAQWHPNRFFTFSGGLRWEREQLPPPIAALDNPQLPFTERLPDLGNNWGPRASLALGEIRKHWPVLRLGYGMYYGRVENATVEAAMTQTGSLKGDLYFFMRPQDDCQYCLGGAPPFPYVFAGEPANLVMPSALGFAPRFRNPEVHEAVASIQQPLPSHMMLTASAMVSLGRRLPIAVDSNLSAPTAAQTITYNVCEETPYTAPGANGNGQPSNLNGACGNLGLGPVKASQITMPFYASWPGQSGPCPYYTPQSSGILPGRPCPDYQQISQIVSRANSTYEAATVKLSRYGRHGLGFHAYYTYAHAMDWNPDGVTLAPGNDLLDPNPAYWSEQYGTGNLDVRHSAAMMAIYETPWKLRGFTGRIGNGWILSGIGEFHSGLPYSMRVSGSLPTVHGLNSETVVGLGPSPNGSGGDNLLYGVGNDGVTYNIGRNSFRYSDVWKADMRLGKSFDLGGMRQLELMAETFNLFNHQNVTEIETTGYTIENGGLPSSTTSSGALPSINFLTGLHVNPKTGIPSQEFGQPLTINGTNFYRERQIEFGLKMNF